RRRHTRSYGDWSSDVCSSDLVCKLLNVCPEVVRAEIFADASLSWLDYWTKRAGNVSRRMRASFGRAFAGRNHPEGTKVKPVGFMDLNEYEKTVHPIC